MAFRVSKKNAGIMSQVGLVDGDSEHPYYKYGGMWKNKHAGVSAKKTNKSKAAQERSAVGNW